MLKIIYCLNVLVAVRGFRVLSTPEPEVIKGVVGIQINGVPKCLGAFVGAEKSKFIATAAHCVYGVQASRLEIVKGEAKPIQVKRVINHPYYMPPSPDYDIALIKTIEEDQGLLLDKNVPPSGTNLKVFVWDSKEKKINSTTATIEDRKSCRAKMANHTVVSTRMLCANTAPGSGMDGSPLTNGTNIVGVGSYHVGEDGEKYPKIFTNIANSEIYSFIERYTD